MLKKLLFYATVNITVKKVVDMETFLWSMLATAIILLIGKLVIK